MTIETAATLLERDRELGQFGRAFSEAEEGRGQFVSVDSGVVAAYIVALDSGTVWLCFSVRSADSGSVPSDCSVTS
jgi:hypothetical protein